MAKTPLRSIQVIKCPASCNALAEKDRILVSYETCGVHTAYVEPVAVGDALPDMPLFLPLAGHLLVPLELTYQAAWDASPEELRQAVEFGIMPDGERA